jgi:hypothetical protein
MVFCQTVSIRIMRMRGWRRLVVSISLTWSSCRFSVVSCLYLKNFQANTNKGNGSPSWLSAPAVFPSSNILRRSTKQLKISTSSQLSHSRSSWRFSGFISRSYRMCWERVGFLLSTFSCLRRLDLGFCSWMRRGSTV